MKLWGGDGGCGGWGWHFIAATPIAIKPLKAACKFAADDIFLYEFCYIIQYILILPIRIIN